MARNAPKDEKTDRQQNHYDGEKSTQVSTEPIPLFEYNFKNPLSAWTGTKKYPALIIVSANASVGCGVYPRPEREGVKPSPTMAETMIKPEN